MTARTKPSAAKPARTQPPARRPSAKKTAKRPTAKRTAKRSAAASSATTDGTSKQSRLIGLLQSDAGATLDQMVQLTGWQPHTVRGTVSGVLRKRLGLNVTTQAQADGPRVYRIVGKAA
jgi:hypothetical protein